MCKVGSIVVCYFKCWHIYRQKFPGLNVCMYMDKNWHAMRKVIEAKLAGIVKNIRARKPFYN